MVDTVDVDIVITHILRGSFRPRALEVLRRACRPEEFDSHWPRHEDARLEPLASSGLAQFSHRMWVLRSLWWASWLLYNGKNIYKWMI